MKRAFSMSLLVLGNFIQVYSQNPKQYDTLKISLRDVWQKAEEHSRAIEIRKKEVSITGEEVKDAIMDRLPEMGIAGTYERATNIPIYDNGLFSAPSYHEVIKNLYKVSGDFYLNIYNGNKLNLKIKEVKTLHEISLIQKDQTISDIRYISASFYLELQKSIMFRNLVIQDIAEQEKQLAEMKAFHKNGIILKSDVLRAELDLSERKMLLVQIENDILIVNQKLNIIIGEPDERTIAPLEIKDFTGNEISGYDDCLNNAFLNSYSFHISEKKTELSELHLKQVKANVRPKVGLTGDFYYMNPQIFLYPYNPYWYSLGLAGLKASFPISSLYHNIHKERSARLELDKEEVTHKDIEDTIRQQVNEAYLRYKEALLQIEVSKLNVDQAAENARIIKENYFNQAALVTDLLDADVQVLQTKFELASARITAQNKYFLLQNIIGTL